MALRGLRDNLLKESEKNVDLNVDIFLLFFAMFLEWSIDATGWWTNTSTEASSSQIGPAETIGENSFAGEWEIPHCNWLGYFHSSHAKCWMIFSHIFPFGAGWCVFNISDSAAKTATTRDALHPKSQQYGICVFAGTWACCGLSDEGEKGSNGVTALPVCTMQNRFHTCLEMGETG